MRRMSNIRRTRNDEARPVREAYRWQHSVCQFPRCSRQTVDIHEIVRGPSRVLALDEPCALLALCRRHHDELHQQGLLYGLAVKWLAQDGTWDLSRVLDLLGRAGGAITILEVQQRAERIE